MNTPVLSITIATYNRSELLSKVLNALDKQLYVNKDEYEIIVCDSHSSDSTEKIYNEFSKKSAVRCNIVHTKNILAAKRNIGIYNSSGSWVVFLDDDCVPEPDYVQKIFEFINLGDTNLIGCGLVEFPHFDVKKSNYINFKNQRHVTAFSKYNAHSLPFYHIVVMNMCFNKNEFIKKIKTVDESFVGYGCEDTELGWRIIKSGFRLVPTRAKIIHYEPSSIEQFYLKLVRASRDGFSTLIARQPEAATTIPNIEYLENNIFTTVSFRSRFFYKFFLILSYFGIQNLVIKVLNITDGCKLLYSPRLFKVLMVMAHIEGAKTRINRITTVTNDWYK